MLQLLLLLLLLLVLLVFDTSLCTCHVCHVSCAAWGSCHHTAVQQAPPWGLSRTPLEPPGRGMM